MPTDVSFADIESGENWLKLLLCPSWRSWKDKLDQITSSEAGGIVELCIWIAMEDFETIFIYL